MDNKRFLWGIVGVGVLLTLAQCSQPLPETESSRAAESSKAIRIAGAGNSYAGFSRVAVLLLSNLKPLYPDRDMWMDYHNISRAFRDGILLVGDGKAEVVFVNTPHLAAMAVAGRGLFDRPVPLRGIGVYPSEDWTVLAVDPKLGIRSFADLREKRYPLKIATGYTDGDNVLPVLLKELLERHGIPLEEFGRWGGQIIGSGPSGAARQAYVEGKADAVFHESGYDDRWLGYMKQRPMTFVGAEPQVVQQMEKEFGWPSVTVPANYYPGQTKPFQMLDFGSWMICVRQDIEDDLAYRIAQIFIEKVQEVDPAKGGFGGNPQKFDPVTAIQVPIPLHPGAMRYYREKGLLQN